VCRTATGYRYQPGEGAQKRGGPLRILDHGRVSDTGQHLDRCARNGSVQRGGWGAPSLVLLDGGYADQSHPHRDVVALTRATPATVATEPWLAIDDIAWPGLGHARRM